MNFGVQFSIYPSPIGKVIEVLASSNCVSYVPVSMGHKVFEALSNRQSLDLSPFLQIRSVNRCLYLLMQDSVHGMVNVEVDDRDLRNLRQLLQNHLDNS